MDDRGHRDEVFEEPFPSLDEQRQYLGKVVAYDCQGRIHVSADSWSEVLAQMTAEMRESLTLLYLPEHAVIAGLS